MENTPSEAEKDTLAAFKRVRHRLQKYNGREIILGCIWHMMKPDADTVEQMRLYAPWLLFLLIKWTAQYGEFTSPYRYRLSEPDLNYLVNLVKDYERTARLPSQFDDIFLFFKNLAYQQFWIQEPRPPAIARQSLLFGSLPQNHPFRVLFTKETGVTIEEFVELSFMLLSRFLDPNDVVVTEAWFDPVAASYAPGAIGRLLTALSLDYDGLRSYLGGMQRDKHSIAHELYEQTPLKRYALLKVNETYYPYSTGLVLECVKTFVYDLLRGQDPQFFMDKFGPLFEDYVGKCWSCTELPFVTEQQLRTELKSSSRLVDFLVVDSHTNIFVDAKGVEMANLGKITHKADILRGKTRDSLIKAIPQGFATAQAISTIKRIGDVQVGDGENYLLVVTFADLYVGSGRQFYNVIAKDALDQILTDYGGKPWIPFENMYFINVDDLDLLAGCLKGGQTYLGELLRHAVVADSSPQAMRFAFRQHIYEACPEPPPPQYLHDEAELIAEHSHRRFRGEAAVQ